MIVAPAEDNVAYYYAQDDVKHMKVNVLLQELTSADLISASPREAAALSRQYHNGSSIGISDIHRNKEKTFSELVEVKWGQKILSPYERQRKEDSRKTPDVAIKRIFTYTDKEKMHDQVSVSTYVRESADDITMLRRLKNVRLTDPNLEMEDLRQRNFFIMADLSPIELLGETREFELELCRISWNNVNQLTVSPDFNNGHGRPYRKSITGKVEIHYEFSVTNMSSTRPTGWRNAVQGQTETSPNKSEKDFAIPPLPANVSFIFSVAGEIMRFLGSHVGANVYISYALHLPYGWYSLDGISSCEGLSHVSLLTHGSEGEVEAVFCLPINVCLAARAPGQGRPTILLAVYETHSCGRETDLGYAAVQIPLPGEGSEIRRTPLWVSSLNAPSDVLTQHFLPSCRLLPSASYLTLESKSDELGTVSRYGVLTESRGSIEWRLQTAIRSDQFMEPTFDDFPSSDAADTRNVLEHFRRSRRKLRLLNAAVKRT